MRVVMLSTDRLLLEPGSQVALRTEKYADHLESLTIVLAGVGDAQKSKLSDKVTIIYPGGGSKAKNFFRMLRTARDVVRADPPSVITCQDPFFLGVIGVIAARAAHVSLQVQVHTDFVSRAFVFESVRHCIQYCLALCVLPFASCVRVVTSQLAHRVRRYTSAPVSVLPIFTDLIRVHHKHPRPKELGDHPSVLTVSRLAPEKNIDLVIRSLVRVPEAHLYIVGSGTEHAKLEDEVRVSGMSERVHFLGWVADPTPYLQHADCFVQMSSYEGYGVSLVEALASGIPIVTTDVGVVAELPIDAVTIVPCEEYALARAVRTTLDSITQTRRRQKDARTSFLHKILSEDQYVQKYIELLHTCGS